MNVVALGTSNRGEILTQQAIHRAADITRLVQCREPLSRDLDDNTLKRLKAELGWYSCAQYNPAHRAKANIAGPLHLLSFDVDEGTLPDLSAYSGVVIETATSAPGAQRWRVHLDLAEPVPVELYTSVLEAFCSTHNVPIDEGAKDPSRLWYRRVQRVTFLDGAPLDWRLLFGELKPKSKAETLAAHGITPEGWTVDDVREALLALKPKDGDREMWRNVTWGFKAAGGDRETWLRWCDTLPGQDKNLKARTNDARVWDDDKGEGITSLTFTKAAREAGFVPRAERPEIILADFPIEIGRAHV